MSAEAEQVHGPQCIGLTKKGTRCTMKTGAGYAYCLAHDPDEKRRALFLETMRANGRSGRKRQIELRRAAKEATERIGQRTPLETHEQIREMLERASAAVEASGHDAVIKGNVIARLAKTAHDVLAASDTEKSLADMRAQIEALEERNGRRAH